MLAGATAQQPAPDERALQALLDEVRALKMANQSREALARIERALPVGGPERGVVVGKLLCQAAEALRQLRRWSESEPWLVRAAKVAAALEPGPEQTRMLRHIDVLWGLLDWARGLPDLAFEAVQRVRQRPATDHDDARDACVLELLVLRALDREPAAGFAALQAYEASYGRNHDLRVRTAAMVMDQQPPAAADLALARQWLAEAAADDGLPLRERLIARTFGILGQLNAGDLAEAARQLEHMEAALHAAGGEPPLNLPALSLRLALDAGLDAATVQARHDRALAAWRDALDAWAQQHPQPHGLGPLAAADRQRLLCELMRARLRLQPGAAGARAALQLLLEAEALGTMARTVAAAAPDVDALVRTVTTRDGGALAYCAGPDRTLAFRIGADGVQAFELPVRGLAIERQARELTLLLQTVADDPGPARAAVEATAAHLAAWLLPPPLRASLAPWRQVAIVGIESLGYVPFELLRDDAGERLGTALAVRYLPSLVIGAWLHDHRPPPTPTASARLVLTACPEAVGQPDEDTAAPLPFGPGEQRLATGEAAADAFVVRAGAAATLAASAEALRGADYWVVIAHGVRNDRRLDPQGIRFGDGQVAWADDFAAMALPAQVFFGACRAGRGRLRRGDDGRHLLHGAAMLAGARAVVTPWLEVDYRATLQLLGAVHGAMFTDGLTLADALWQARRQLAAEHGDELLTPFLFHLHGLGDQTLPTLAPTPPPPDRAWWWAGAALALLAVVAAWSCTRRRG